MSDRYDYTPGNRSGDKWIRVCTSNSRSTSMRAFVHNTNASLPCCQCVRTSWMLNPLLCAMAQKAASSLYPAQRRCTVVAA